MTRCLIVLTAFVLAATSLALADVNDKVKEMQPPKDSKEFASKAAEGGLLEVRLAQLAQQKASSDEVKQIAKKLEQDHTQANNELKQIAQNKGVNWPNDISGECREVYDAFSRLDGKTFDNAYLLHMIKDHLKDTMMFQSEARSGTDPEIKAWAAKTLPTLRQHTAHINTVAQACGIPVDALAGSGRMDSAQPAGSKQGPSETGSGSMPHRGASESGPDRSSTPGGSSTGNTGNTGSAGDPGHRGASESGPNRSDK